MSFAPYPAYRPSLANWLGDVPKHWRTNRLARISQSGMGQTILKDMLDDPGTPEALPVFSASETDEEFGFLVNPTIRLAPGDIVVGARGSIGKARRIVAPSTCTQTTIWVRPDHSMIDPDFLYWFMIGERDALFPFDKTAIPMLTVEQVRAAPVPLPERVEQREIAAFLDQETGKIDALVQAQRRLIELLTEKRQAVISHAVTKGLEPTAPMKHSGVGWLGEVPAHWEVTTVGRVCEALSYGFTNPMPTAEDGPYMLTANDIGDGAVAFDTARKTTWEAFEALTPKSRPQDGDVLLTKDGTLGRIAIHDGRKACINQSVAFLRASRSSISPAFLAQALANGAYQDRMIFEAGGTTIKHIYISRLAKMPLAVPPVQESTQIATRCSEVLEKSNELIRSAAEGINLLQERRAALISAAVTGKIDVRGLTPEQADAA